MIDVQIEVEAVAESGQSDKVTVSSNGTRGWSVVLMIGEEMATVRASDLEKAIERCRLDR